MEAGWGKLTVQEALRGKECQLSQAMGIPGCEGWGKTSKAGKASGRLSQQLEHCCPLVATSAATNCRDFRKQVFSCWYLPQFPCG